jgi:hypothetical protein
VLTAARARARCRPSLAAGVVLCSLVVVIAGARLVASLRFSVPWVAPDEMVYGLLGQDLWERGSLTIRGFAVPYHSLLYPAFVGLPLSLGDLSAGIRAVQAVQSVVMALTAVPVYLWGRHFLPRGWALAAAALTVAAPALTYAGLLMTEALYYPATVLALAALARVLESPTLVRQGAFLLTVTLVATVRLQGLVLLPALVGAALLFALLVRSPAVVARLWPLLATLTVATVAAALAVLVRDDLGLDDLVGAHAAGVRRASSDLGWEFVRHAGYVTILVAFVPAICLGTLVWRSIRIGEADVPTAAFLAAAASYIPLLAVQVAAFAVDNLDHVGGRYLVTAVPPLALAVCLWGARGAPWERVGTPIISAAMLACLALTPVDESAAANSAHDLFETLAVRHLAGLTTTWVAHLIVMAAALAAILALALVSIACSQRRRSEHAASVLVAAVGATLVSSSAFAAVDVARLSEQAQTLAFGESRASWVDETGAGPSVFLATGASSWTSNARLLFWNESIRRIVALPGAEWHGPIPVLPATLEPDGSLVDASGRALAAPVVVAPRSLSLEGTALASAPATADAPATILWRTAGAPLRATTETMGFTPVGDFGGEPARVIIFGCTRGSLGLTLLGKQGLPIAVGVNGIPREAIVLPAGKVWRGSILAPPDADGHGVCEFTLESAGLVGSTRIEWIPPSSPAADGNRTP